MLGFIFLVMCCKVLEKVLGYNRTTVTTTWTRGIEIVNGGEKIVNGGEKVVSSCENDGLSIIAAHFIKLYHNGELNAPFVLM